MLTSSINRTVLCGTLSTVVSIASGCTAVDRLSQIGENGRWIFVRDLFVLNLPVLV